MRAWSKFWLGHVSFSGAINWEGVFARERERAEAHGPRTILRTTTYESPSENDASAVSKTVLISNSRKL